MTFATLPYLEKHASPWSECLCVKPESMIERVLLCFARGFWFEHPIAGRVFVLERRRRFLASATDPKADQ